MASSFRDAFSKASIVQANLPQMTAQVAAVQVQSAPMALPDAQAPQPINAEPWAGNPAVPQWCAVLSEVIPTKTLIAALDHATCEGTGAARAAFEARVEGAIAQLTKRQGDELRARMGRGGWRNKGVPTWCADAREALECLQAGGHLAWAAERRRLAEAAKGVVVPAPQADEDPDAYNTRLQIWEEDQVPAHLEVIGYDRYRLVQAMREAIYAQQEAARKVEEAARDRIVAGLAAPIITALATGKTPTEGIEAAMRLYEQTVATSPHAYYVACAVFEAAEKSAYPWTMHAKLNLGSSRPAHPKANTSLTPEDAEGLSANFLLEYISNPDYTGLVAEARRRWPHTKDEVYVIPYEGSVLVIRDGVRQPYVYVTNKPPQAGAYSTVPCARGWWGAKGYAGPAVWQAMQVLKAMAKGHFYLGGGVMDNYSRHPERGYGRLSWGVRAGGSHDGFELPVEEALAKRLDTIALVRAASDLLPEDAFWVPAMIGTTQQGRPRLVLDRSPRPSKRSSLVALSATMMSQGRHGWSGDARKAEVRNGDGASAVLKTMHVTSRGGGLASSLSVAVLVEGEPPLPTGSGSGLVFAEAGGYRREAILTDPQ